MTASRPSGAGRPTVSANFPAMIFCPSSRRAVKNSLSATEARFERHGSNDVGGER